MKVAVLFDGGYVFSTWFRITRQYPTAMEIHHLAMTCVKGDEDIFRIYYYDCLPFDGTIMNPNTGIETDCSTTPIYVNRTRTYKQLAAMKKVAFRRGELKFRGWKIPLNQQRKIVKSAKGNVTPTLKPSWQQKGVDIKIGLDIAWLSSKQIVEKIILCSNDTDFVPAMKFARREAIQVVIASLEQNDVQQKLKEHSDEIRRFKPSEVQLSLEVRGLIHQQTENEI